MEDEISAVLYDEEDGVMIKLRDGEVITDDEKEAIISFSKLVNEHLKDEKATAREIAILFDIIYTFMLYEDMQDFATELYQNVTESLDF